MSTLFFNVLLIIFALVFIAFVYTIESIRRSRLLKKQRLEFIKNYRFPAPLRSKLMMKYSNLNEKNLSEAETGLRQFFAACLMANAVKNKKLSLGMPSKLVDEAWHAFILMSREYQQFCDKAFGKFLHHTPHELMKVGREKSLNETWHHVMNVRPQPTAWFIGAAPLLFLMDERSMIGEGWVWDQSQLTGFADAAKQRESGSSDSSGGGDSSSSDSGDSGCGGGGYGGGGCGS